MPAAMNSLMKSWDPAGDADLHGALILRQPVGEQPAWLPEVPTASWRVPAAGRPLYNVGATRHQLLTRPIRTKVAGRSGPGCLIGSRLGLP
jgi:hypothetical protein